MSDKGVPFADPDATDEGDRTITARWNQGGPDAEGWQQQGLLTVTHFKGHGYRAIAMNCRIRRAGSVQEEDLGDYQYAVVLDVPTRDRYSAKQLRQVYAEALNELRRQLTDGAATLAAYFPQHD